MRYRKLGKTPMEFSEIGYGAWGIGGKQWLGGSDDESVQAVQRAFELGLNFMDTALAYGEGHSEQLVGKLVRESGKRIYIATKVPPMNQIFPPDASVLSGVSGTTLDAGVPAGAITVVPVGGR